MAVAAENVGCCETKALQSFSNEARKLPSNVRQYFMYDILEK
jgi:hypothetical protein